MVKKLLRRGYFGLILFFLYAPIAVLMVYSFNGESSRAVWGGFSLKWYGELVKSGDIMSALFVTVAVALLASLISCVIGTLSAIGLFNLRKNTRSLLLNLSNIPMMNSDTVTGISLMMLFVSLGVTLGFQTLVISHVAFCIPYVIVSVLPRLYQTNRDVYDAALDLGASRMQIYRRIVIPDIMPGIVSGFLLSLTLSIDDFAVSFFNTDNGVENLSTLIYTMTKRGVNPRINALSTIMFIAIILLLVTVNLITMPKKRKKLPDRV